MLALANIPPARRPELLLRPIGEKGRCVVKDPRTGAYFDLGEQEYFLLVRLDGKQSAEDICAAFTEQFGEPLSEEDLQEFLELAGSRGFLRLSAAPETTQENTCAGPAASDKDRAGSSTPPVPAVGGPVLLPPRPRQSLLYWRKSLFDPDRLFTWLAPRIWFFWTRTFLVISAGCILLATMLAWANCEELVSRFAHALRWETVVLAWLTMAAVTTCHEFAHGLTCKHHGGEVHEVGFLFMYLMPCFYCNVSDAWLFREKSKRLWVTLAGAYCDLVLWALAVFIWRLTLPDSLVNYLAWMVLSVCGARLFFNFNPFLKLDGYYLLSDWQEVPNLRQRAWDYVAAHLRWLLWGAARAAREPRGTFLLVYGVTSWLFSLTYLVLMLVVFFYYLGGRWGLVGVAAVVLLGLSTLPGLFRGLGGGEVKQMILLRRKRTAVWLLILAAIPLVLCFWEVEDRVGGPFQVRSARRVELRASVTGFLREVHFEEGAQVRPGALVARVEVPDLASRTRQKHAEVGEVKARLRLLEVGPRPEEVAEQRHRVRRAREWRDLAAQDLERGRQAYQEELARLDKLIAQHRAEQEFARESLTRLKKLRDRNVTSEEEIREMEKRGLVCQTQVEQTQAQKQARIALGTLEAETELARRAKEMADAQATLTLLEAGTRAEEVEAEKARLARLQEEVNYLEGLQQQAEIRYVLTDTTGQLEGLLYRKPSNGLGVIATPHLREKVGKYVREGELICVIEEPIPIEVEVALAEQEVARVRITQAVDLKARALPFQTLKAQVSRVAPTAGRGEAQPPVAQTVGGELPGTVTVYCELGEGNPDLRSGMTGHARIVCGRRPVGAILLNRMLSYLRTEFWW